MSLMTGQRSAMWNAFSKSSALSSDSGVCSLRGAESLTKWRPGDVPVAGFCCLPCNVLQLSAQGGWWARTARAGYSEGCSGYHLEDLCAIVVHSPFFLTHLAWEYWLDVLVMSCTKTKLNGLQCFLIYQRGIPKKMRNAEFEEEMSVPF